MIILPEGSAVPATSDTGLEWPNGERVYLEPLNRPVLLPDGCDQAVWGQSTQQEVQEAAAEIIHNLRRDLFAGGHMPWEFDCTVTWHMTARETE